MLMGQDFFPVHGQIARRFGESWCRQRADLSVELSFEKPQGFGPPVRPLASPALKTQTNRGLQKTLPEPTCLEKHQDRSQTWPNVCICPLHLSPGLKNMNSRPGVWRFYFIFPSEITDGGGRRSAHREAERVVVCLGISVIVLAPQESLCVFEAFFFLLF